MYVRVIAVWSSVRSELLVIICAAPLPVSAGLLAGARCICTCRSAIVPGIGKLFIGWGVLYSLGSSMLRWSGSRCAADCDNASPPSDFPATKLDKGYVSATHRRVTS